MVGLHGGKSCDLKPTFAISQVELAVTPSNFTTPFREAIGAHTGPTAQVFDRTVDHVFFSNHASVAEVAMLWWRLEMDLIEPRPLKVNECIE